MRRHERRSKRDPSMKRQGGEDGLGYQQALSLIDSCPAKG